MLIKDKDGNEIPFEYSPTWYHHPIIIGDKKYDLDPSITVPVPESHPDYGKTVQEIVGIATITDAMITEHKEKDTWEQMRENIEIYYLLIVIGHKVQMCQIRSNQNGNHIVKHLEI